MLKEEDFKIYLYCKEGIIFPVRKARNEIIKLICPFSDGNHYCNSICAQFFVDINNVNENYCWVNVYQSCTGKEHCFKGEDIL